MASGLVKWAGELAKGLHSYWANGQSRLLSNSKLAIYWHKKIQHSLHLLRFGVQLRNWKIVPGSAGVKLKDQVEGRESQEAIDERAARAKHCTDEGVKAGFKAATIACVASAVPTLTAARMVPWFKANLNYTGQALIISAGHPSQEGRTSSWTTAHLSSALRAPLIASPAGRSYEKEKEATEFQGEAMQLKRDLKEADDQCLLLFGEVQKAWKLASSLQEDLNNHETYINELQVENNRLSEQKSRHNDQYECSLY